MAVEHRIHAHEVQVDDERVVFPTDTQRVASYNWSTTSTSGQPRIIVPGSPLNYLPPKRPVFQLSRDPTVCWFEDVNVTNMSPFSPMEPLFHSLSICAPDLDVSAFDVVAEKFELKRLLRFSRSPGDKDMEYSGLNNQPFRFFIHAKGDDREGKPPTLVFSPARAEEEGEKYQAGFGGSLHGMVTVEDSSTPSDAVAFQLITKMELDGMALLVRSCVGARDIGLTGTPRRRANNMGAVNERLRDLLLQAVGQAPPQGQASTPSPAKKAPSPSASSAPVSSSSDAAGQNGEKATPASPAKTVPPLPSSSSSGKTGSSTGSGLESMQSGELLSEDAKLVEIKAANGRWERNHNWKDFLWHQLLGGAQSLVLGEYELQPRSRDVARFERPEHLGIEEIQARADETGSSSLVYLANTLREVVQVAHRLIANSQRVDDGEGDRPGVVVEYTPGGEKVLRLRLAVPEDGAIAP